MALNIHVYPSDLTHETRMLRITAALARNRIFSVIELLGMNRHGLTERVRLDAERTLVKLPAPDGQQDRSVLFRSMRLLSWSVRAWGYLRSRSVTCINAHSLSVLPLCAAAATYHAALLVYEPHELETESISSHGLRRLLARGLERWLIRRCDAVIVVSDSIAEWYEQRYRIARPLVIRNCCDTVPRSVSTRDSLRKRLGLRDDAITFIYQGGLMPGRGIERLLRVFEHLPSVDLLFMGNGPLTPTILRSSVHHANIHHHPAVPPAEVLEYTSCADVGLCLTEPVCLSYAYSLPNKLFEYLAAGLPVIASDLPEQSRFITEHACGWIISAEDDSLSALITSLDRNAIATRLAAVHRAAGNCSWSAESERLTALCRTLVHD